jgi:hypothetical protein
VLSGVVEFEVAGAGDSKPAESMYGEVPTGGFSAIERRGGTMPSGKPVMVAIAARQLLSAFSVAIVHP